MDQTDRADRGLDDPETERAHEREGDEVRDLRRLFELAQDLLCVATTDGYFTRVNPAFERALGYSPEELKQQTFLEFVHPDDRAATRAELERLSEGHATIDFENRYRAKDGGYRWLAWRSTPATGDDGLVYAIARDVTEMKAAQRLVMEQAEKLRRSNAELERFAYVVSHDLQAPLRAIDNLASWIEEDLSAEASVEVVEHLSELRDRVDGMQDLILELLRYSRAEDESGRVELVDTGQLVWKVVGLLGPPAGFDVAVDDAMPTVRTVRAPLEQVFRNLLANAIEHHDRPSGRIEVAATEQEGRWYFRVTDDGPGIPDDLRDEVFRMFESQGASGGSGIGMSLVRRAVESRGGSVWIEPADGRGTTVAGTVRRSYSTVTSKSSSSRCRTPSGLSPASRRSPPTSFSPTCGCRE